MYRVHRLVELRTGAPFKSLNVGRLNSMSLLVLRGYSVFVDVGYRMANDTANVCAKDVRQAMLLSFEDLSF